MLVILSGELGNHLFILANAREMQRYVEQELPGVRVEMIGQHQSTSKWVRPASDLHQCFVNFQDFVFTGGIHDEEHNFAAVEELQEEWLGPNKTSLLANIQTPKQIHFLRSLLEQQPQALKLEHGNEDFFYSLPYLTTTSFKLHPPYLLNNESVYRDLREFLRFRDESVDCCPTRVGPDETVFHLRNFFTELQHKTPQFRKAHDIIELSPKETADLVFGEGGKGPPPTDHTTNTNSHTGGQTAIGRAIGTRRNSSKIVVIGRFAETSQPYVEALQSQGWKVQFVEGQTGVQDFCVALSATHTLVGLRRSTFAFMAGLLGNATTVRLYHVSPNIISPKDLDAPSLLQRTSLTLHNPDHDGDNNDPTTTRPKKAGREESAQHDQQHPHLLHTRQFWYELYSRREEIITVKSVLQERNR